MGVKIAFVNGKGGVGKTTVTTLIAAAFKEAKEDVGIEDRDPQLSSSTAAEIFNIPIGGSHDKLFIDTPGTQGPATRDAIRTANLVILVTTPSPLDMATTAATAAWIQAERGDRPTRVLLNRVQVNNSYYTAMRDNVKSLPYPVFETYLPQRTSYLHAQVHGWRAIPAAHRTDVIKLAIEIAKVIQQLPAETTMGEGQHGE